MNLTLLKTRLKSEPGWVICGCTAMWRATGAIPSLGRVGGCRKALTSECLKKKQGHTANHASPNPDLAQASMNCQKGRIMCYLLTGWGERPVCLERETCPLPHSAPHSDSEKLDVINDLFSLCWCSGVTEVGEQGITACAAAVIIIIWQ